MIDSTAAKVTAPSVRAMSSLMAPDISSGTSEVAISDGGITTFGLMKPRRQASSSAPIAATTTAPDPTDARHCFAMGGRPSDFERFAAQIFPEPAGDLAESRVADDRAVALARPTGLDDLDETAGPRRHDADAVRQHGRLVERMGDQQHGGAGLAPQPQQLVAHQQPRLLIERAERLVEQDEARLQHQGAGDAHALAHAAGKLRRIGAANSLQPHESQRVLDPAARLPRRRCRCAAGRRRHCPTTVSQGKQASSWKTTPTPSGTSPVTGFPSKLTVPAVGGCSPAENFEQGRFAAAGRADDGEELAAPQFEVDGTQRMDRLMAGLARKNPRYTRELCMDFAVRSPNRSFLQIGRQERCVDHFGKVGIRC